MRNEKVLVKLLRSVAELLGDEASRNPAFAERLGEIVRECAPPSKQAKPPKASPAEALPLPDLHAEWTQRGEMDFRVWLRDQPITQLRALIRSQDFDSARRTSKWKDGEKLAGFIADSLRARMAKGGSFLVRPQNE